MYRREPEFTIITSGAVPLIENGGEALLVDIRRRTGSEYLPACLIYSLGHQLLYSPASRSLNFMGVMFWPIRFTSREGRQVREVADEKLLILCSS